MIKGTISHSELKSVMRRFGQNLSDSEVRDMIRSVDIDRNNEIDFTEFLHLMKSRISHDPDYELKLAFQMIDTDSSGTICVDELRALMRKVNQNLSEQEIDAIMHECDADGNRELDFDEFKQLMVRFMVKVLSDVIQKDQFKITYLFNDFFMFCSFVAISTLT